MYLKDRHRSSGMHSGWEQQSKDLKAITGASTAVNCKEMAQADVREIKAGNAFEGKPGNHGGRVILLNHMQGLEPSLWPLSLITHRCQQLSNTDKDLREAGL